MIRLGFGCSDYSRGFFFLPYAEILSEMFGGYDK